MAPHQAVVKPEQPSPATQKDDRPLSTSEVRELQERLKALGFDPGFIDGIPGPQTASAIRRFEASVAVPPQGNIDRPTLQRLRDAKPAR
jgi:peptidoglycan hydrolase-like protein with peptidoglycan-binding domain